MLSSFHSDLPIDTALMTVIRFSTGYYRLCLILGSRDQPNFLQLKVFYHRGRTPGFMVVSSWQLRKSQQTWPWHRRALGDPLDPKALRTHVARLLGLKTIFYRTFELF